MKNFKERFNKSRFLIPLVVGILLTIITIKVLKMSYAIGFGIFFITILASIHQYRMTNNKDYNKKQARFLYEEKQLPWHRKFGAFRLVKTLWCFMIFSPLIIIFIIWHFFSTGFASGIWHWEAIIYIILLCLFFVACKKSLTLK